MANRDEDDAGTRGRGDGKPTRRSWS